MWQLGFCLSQCDSVWRLMETLCNAENGVCWQISKEAGFVTPNTEWQTHLRNAIYERVPLLLLSAICILEKLVSR